MAGGLGLNISSAASSGADSSSATGSFAGGGKFNKAGISSDTVQVGLLVLAVVAVIYFVKKKK